MRILAFLFLMCGVAAAQSVYIGEKQVDPTHITERGEKIYVRTDDLFKLGKVVVRPLIGGKEIAVWRNGRGGAFKIVRGEVAKDAAVIREPDGTYLSLELLEKKLAMTVERKGSSIVIHTEEKAFNPPRIGLGPGNGMTDFTLPQLGSNKSTTLSKLGKKTLIFFWSSWEQGREDLKAIGAFYKKNRRWIDVVTVASDFQVDRVKKYVPGGFTPPVLLDSDMRVAAGMGLNRLPHWILVDDVGLIRGAGTRFDEAAITPMVKEAELGKDWKGTAFIPEPRKMKGWQEAVKKNGSDPYLRLGLASAYLRDDMGAAAETHIKKAEADNKARPYAALLRAAVMINDGKKPAAIKYLRGIREKDADCQLIRKQIWALRFPDKFYKGKIDFAWQKHKESEERLQRDE